MYNQPYFFYLLSYLHKQIYYLGTYLQKVKNVTHYQYISTSDHVKVQFSKVGIRNEEEGSLLSI